MLIAIVIFTNVITGLSESPSSSIQWYTYDQGMILAKEQNKPAMIDFTAEWCGWCEKLDLETYSDEKLVNLADKLICIKVDADEEKAIARKFRIDGLPTVVFTDPEGNEVHRVVGYLDSNDFMKEINTVLGKNSPIETLKEKERSNDRESPGFGAILTFAGIIMALYLFIRKRDDR